jgi:two-component system sensor kinase FixL
MAQSSGEKRTPNAHASSRGALALRFFTALTALPLHWRIGGAALALIMACGLRYGLMGVFGEHRFYFAFYPAIAVVALLLGTFAGAATALLAAAAAHFDLGAGRGAPINDGMDFLILVVFLFNCAALIFLAELLQGLARARRESEELVRLNAEQLGHFVEQAPAAMAMFDSDMFYLAASARWREEFGLSPDLVGKSHYDVFPEIGEEWRDVHRRALAGECANCEQDRFERADGSVHWLRWEVQPWRQAQGGVGGVVIFSEDISDRMRIEEALRNNEKRLKAIVDAAMEAIVAIDGKGVIQSANPAALEMFGYEKSELLGRNVSLLMPDPYRNEHDRYIAAYQRGGEKNIIGRRRKVEGRRKVGEVFPLELTVSEAPFNKEMLFVGFLRDMGPIEAERRRVNTLREELVHVSRLNDMGEMVAGLAHEVGQPIAAILNFAAAHRRAMAATGEAPEPDLIAKIEAQARRAAEILKRLRGFIEKRPPERTIEKIDDLIEDAIKLALLRSRAKITTFPPDPDETPIRVCVDRIQIEQVLVNLLRNADDALVDTVEPEILIETARMEPGKILVSVADNGEGVHPEALEQLFKAFSSAKQFGMGVGLSIGKSIVEDHGGVIAYRPNAPRGSIFEFTLPIHDGEGDSADGGPDAP